AVVFPPHPGEGGALRSEFASRDGGTLGDSWKLPPPSYARPAAKLRCPPHAGEGNRLNLSGIARDQNRNEGGHQPCLGHHVSLPRVGRAARLASAASLAKPGWGDSRRRAEAPSFTRHSPTLPSCSPVESPHP